MGAERFEHLTHYRRDPLLYRLLGLPSFPSPDTLRRFFHSFTYRRTTKGSEALLLVSLRTMRLILLAHTLDPDSTVFCRYRVSSGQPEGHNLVKCDRPSHHPLEAWLNERRRLLWTMLRGGHARAANGVREFLVQDLTMLPAEHRIGLVRADAGFFAITFQEALQARDLPYIIGTRLTPLVRKLVVHRILDAEWRPVARGIAVADAMVMLPVWRAQPRRFVCLRPQETKGRILVRQESLEEADALRAQSGNLSVVPSRTAVLPGNGRASSRKRALRGDGATHPAKRRQRVCRPCEGATKGPTYVGAELVRISPYYSVRRAKALCV